MFLVVCDVIDRYRILNSVYRGHITTDSKYLARALKLKIIIHTNYLYTSTHPQRTHHPLELTLDDVDDVEFIDAPVDPELGSGYQFDDFSLGDKVQVWYMRSWWHGKVTYLSHVGQTLTVRLVGSRDSMSGILPRHTKPAHDAE